MPSLPNTMTAVRVTPRPGRVLVKPDPLPNKSEGGILIPDQLQAWMPRSTGTVMAVGPGDPDSQRRIVAIRARAIRDCIDIVEDIAEQFRHTPELQCALDELGRYLCQEPEPEYPVQVGDRVVFPNGLARGLPATGFEMTDGDGGDWLVLCEADVLASLHEVHV